MQFANNNKRNRKRFKTSLNRRTSATLRRSFLCRSPRQAKQTRKHKKTRISPFFRSKSLSNSFRLSQSNRNGMMNFWIFWSSLTTKSKCVNRTESKRTSARKTVVYRCRSSRGSPKPKRLKGNKLEVPPWKAPIEKYQLCPRKLPTLLRLLHQLIISRTAKMWIAAVTKETLYESPIRVNKIRIWQWRLLN